ILTTAGITFATARTTGSEAGSVGVDDGNGVVVAAKSRALLANSTAIVVLESWRQTPGSARVSRVGDGVSPSRAFLLHTTNRKDCFGETPKPARETRALPGLLAFDIVVYCIPSGRVKLPAQVTGRPSTVNLLVVSFFRPYPYTITPSFANPLTLDFLHAHYQR